MAAATPWYPPRPHDSSEIAAIYRASQERVVTKGHGRSLVEGYNATTGEAVALWYKHVSNAGGTAI